MGILQNLRIGTRLGVAFAAVLALMLASLTLAIVAMAGMNARTEQIVAVEYRKVKLETTALDNTRGSIARVMQIVGDDDKARAGQGRQRLDANLKAIDDSLATLAPLVNRPEGRKLLESAKASQARYAAAVERTLAVMQTGKQPEAEHLTFGETYGALHAFASDLRALLDFNQKIMDEAGADSERAYATSRMVMIGAALGALVLGVLLAWWITRSITRPLNDAVQLADRVATGDLSSAITSTGRDEVARLLGALGRMNTSLVEIVGSVRQASDSIATGTAQIATGNIDLSQRTEEQASNLQQTAASMEELTSTVRENAETARQATTLASEAATTAAAGGQAMQRVVGTMQEISESSRKIGEIIAVIDGIAFQTNILALNAAVEAARAGEQGRGFAVVAGEVRTLARRSAEAAREIKSLIGSSAEKVEHGGRLVDDAGRTIGQIVSQVERVNTLIGEISHASQEQRGGIEQISTAVDQLDRVTQQNAALVEESAAAAESLKRQAETLSDTVSRFRLAA